MADASSDPDDKAAVKKVVCLRAVLRFLHDHYRRKQKVSARELERDLMEQEKEAFEECGGRLMPLDQWCLHRAAFVRTMEGSSDDVLGPFKNYVAKLAAVIRVADRSCSDKFKPRYAHHIVEGRHSREPDKILSKGGVIKHRVFIELPREMDSDADEDEDEKDYVHSHPPIYLAKGEDPFAVYKRQKYKQF